MRRNRASRAQDPEVPREGPWPFYSELGLAIRRTRQDRGLTQQALASLVRLSRVSVANIEAGRQKMLVHTLSGFAAALEIPVDRLVPNAPPPTGRAAFLELRPEERSFVETVLQGRKQTAEK